MNTRSKLPFLDGMPERLAAAALVSGEEAAWEQGDSKDAVEWLRNAGYAILGIELWLLKQGKISTSINTLSGPVIFCTSCDPLKDERWEDYVQRAARVATESIATFRWPEDSLETSPAYFNLTWADREWFRSRGEFPD
jgi:hypothetical protein